MLSNELKRQEITFAVVTDSNGVVQKIGKSYVLLPVINRKEKVQNEKNN